MNTEQSSIHIRNQPVLRLTDKLARVCFRYAVMSLVKYNSTTCIPVELLGPCFKTGRIVAPRFEWK